MKRNIPVLSCLLMFAACDMTVLAAEDPLVPSGTLSAGRSTAMTSDSPYYDPGSDLTLINDSHYDFYDIAIAEVGDPIWSENLLGSEPLFPGEELTVQNLACGVYDVMIVDHTDTVCVLEGFSLCHGDDLTTWVTDYDLAGANCE